MKITVNNVEVELTPEQVEQIVETHTKEEAKFWKPKNGEKAYYVDSGGSVRNSYRWNSDSDTIIINQGNVFKTSVEAELESERGKAKYRLKKEIFRLNGGERGFVLDKENYCVILSINTNTLSYNSWKTYKIQPSWMYLDSYELAEQLIESHRDDLMLVLSE